MSEEPDFNTSEALFYAIADYLWLGDRTSPMVQAMHQGMQDILTSAREPFYIDRKTGERKEPGPLKMDRPKWRWMMRTALREAGCEVVDEADKGTIRDMCSDWRMNLMLDIEIGHAQGYAYWKSGIDPDVFNEWPAKRLIRVSVSQHPRDWERRWVEAGGRLVDGQMVALKTEPVWIGISRFGKPFPPFDFHSGMCEEDVDRDEAENMGLLIKKRNVRHPLPDPGYGNMRRASLRGLDAEHVDALAAHYGGQIRITQDGFAVWHG